MYLCRTWGVGRPLSGAFWGKKRKINISSKYWRMIGREQMQGFSPPAPKGAWGLVQRWGAVLHLEPAAWRWDLWPPQWCEPSPCLGTHTSLAGYSQTIDSVDINIPKYPIKWKRHNILQESNVAVETGEAFFILSLKPCWNGLLRSLFLSVIARIYLLN